MKVSLSASIRKILRSADPLPTLAIGYILGTITAAGAVRCKAIAVLPLSPLPCFTAFTAAVTCELHLFLITVLAGITRVPTIARIPVLFRSLLWGYGSLRIYLTCGQSLPYFRYVLASGATLLSLCCLARLASDLADRASAPDGTRLFDYFGRCLFYWGVILLTIPLRY